MTIQQHRCLYRISYKDSETKKYDEVLGSHLIMDAVNAYLTVGVLGLGKEKIRIERNNILNIEHICQH